MMHALILHGMGRTPLSMLPLAWRLGRRGLAWRLFGYASTFQSFDAIVERLRRRLESMPAPYVCVGHSLGGLLLRSAICRLDSAVRRPEHLFLLGTPNRSPRLARSIRPRWLFHAINGDCGRLLADPARMDAVPDPRLPTTLIAGTSGPCGAWSPFGDDPNDGVVSLSEVRLPGATMHELPLWHTFMMNSSRVAELIIGAAPAG